MIFFLKKIHKSHEHDFFLKKLNNFFLIHYISMIFTIKITL